VDVHDRFNPCGSRPSTPLKAGPGQRENMSFQKGPWSSLRIILFLLIFLSSCAHPVTRETADRAVAIPDSWSLFKGTPAAPDRWWEAFGSEELNRLIRMALEGSLDLRQAFFRLEQSRALVVREGASRYPELDLRAGATENWRETGTGTQKSRSRDLSLAGSYEVDLWGRVRSEHLQTILEMEASREEMSTAAMTLASEVTLKWLEVISVRRQLDVAQDQLETNRTILDLMRLRYLKGMATALDIYQQRQAVAETEASFPLLEGRLRSLLDETAVLLGKPPRSDLGLAARSFPDPGPLPDAGIPADLLSKRPDIRAAGMRLRAAEGQADAARAARLPALNLTASTGYSSPRLSDLFDNWLATLAASLTMPLFNAGALEAEAERQERVVDERLAAYGQKVLLAVREVEDAMTMEVQQARYIEALEKQLQVSRDGYREALSRYRSGLSDYLPVLTALSGTHRLERSLVTARLEYLSYRVALSRALGGYWMEEEIRQIEEREKDEGGRMKREGIRVN